jgi:hypothetical protein
VAPDVAGAREQPVDQRDGQREEGERPEEPVRPEELELDAPGARGHQCREEHASCPRIGRGLRIRDHEEREEHERAALEPVQGDAERLPEPERPADEQRGEGGEEGHRHVAPGCAVHDQPASRGQDEPEHGRAAPLAGRDPYLAREQHHRHQREVGRVEDMLAPDPQDELARDGDGRGDDHQVEGIGPEQETEREPRDQSALRVEDRTPGQACREELHQQDSGKDRERVGGRQVEAEPPQSVDEEAPEGRDLIYAGVPPAAGLHVLSSPIDGWGRRHHVHAP